MKQILKKLLCALLVLTMTVQLLPATIFATEEEAALPEAGLSDDERMLLDAGSLAADDGEDSREILFEETSLREENVKHFRMSDGTFVAVVYDTPVHYLDDAGQWKEYDNTLHTVSRGEAVTAYRVQNGDSVRTFAADAASTQLLLLQTGDYSLALAPVTKADAELPVVPSQPVEPMSEEDIASETIEEETTASTEEETIVSTEEETTAAVEEETSASTEEETTASTEEEASSAQSFSEEASSAALEEENATDVVASEAAEEERITATVLTTVAAAEEPMDDPFFAQAQPEKLYSALAYENIVNGATLRYENYANSVKESIVISAPQERYSYAFQMQTVGLTPTLQGDGSVSLENEAGEMVYRIPAPYMIDANGEYSYDAAYTLEQTDESWLLTVTADAEWMNAAERAYPVLLDPTVTETAASDDDICAAFVRSNAPDAPVTTDNGLYVGNNGNNVGKTRSYFHINHLPKLPVGCELYAASFSLYHYANTGSSNPVEIGAYALTKAGSLNGHSSTASWKSWANNLTWNQTQYGTTVNDTVILDKRSLTSASAGSYVSWNITTLAYQWYDGDSNTEGNYDVYYKNLGFALRDVNESSSTSRATFYGPKKTSNRPRISISYRNVRGIETDNYTYQTVGIGRAGTAYISDYSMQNTLIVPLASDPSEVMPFSVSLIYDSTMTGRYFSSLYLDGHSKDFSNMLVGIGWKLSLQETVVPLTVGGTAYLIYTDGDGTEHYFKNMGGYYEEEGENSDFVITASGSNYTMSNDYGEKKIFTNGYLTEIQDAYGNALYYCYDGADYSASSTAWKPTSTGAHKITSVYRKNVGCSAVKILLLGYNGNFLSTIIPRCNYSSDDASSGKSARRITLVRETRSGCFYLSAIQYADGAEARYQYFSNSDDFWCKNRMCSAYDAEANYGIDFTYSSNKKLRDAYEYIINSTDGSHEYGAKMHGYKRSHSQAVYRYYGDDQKANTSDDILTFKVLNSMGMTVCSYSTDNTEQHILGIDAAAYTKDSNRKANNRLAASTYSGQPGINLLRDGDAENSGSHWSSVPATTAAHYNGARSYLLNGNSFYQSISLSKDKTYTLSAYVRLDTAASSGGIRLAFLDGNGNAINGASSPLLTTATNGVNGGWQRLTVTYTPTTSLAARASVISTGFSGTAYVDCIQLEEEDAASTYNLVEEGSFEHINLIPVVSGNIFGWYYSGNASIRSNDSGNTNSANTNFGTHGVRINGGSGMQRIGQEIKINAPAGTTFLLSGWGKANALPDSVAEKTTDTQAYFGLIARLYYADNTSDVYYFPFDAYYSDWQQKEGIIAPKKGNQGKAITRAIVVASYDNNINTAWFDNISLRMEPAQTFAYDSNGNPVSAAQSGSGSESTTYSNGVDLTSYTAANGKTKYTYTYNAKHDVLTAKSANVTNTYTYNTAGNVTSSKLTGSGTSMFLQSTYTPTTDKNHIKESTDVNGIKTTYDYDYYVGTVLKVTNANGEALASQYNNANGRIKQVYQNAVASITYGYANGVISTLTRKSFGEDSSGNTVAYWQRYGFNTNKWGQTASITVSGSKNGTSFTSSKTLASYTYAANNGNLTCMTYGNSDSVSYYYDRFDRLIKTVYNDTGRYIEYAYSAEGALAKLTHKDSNGAVLATYAYEYDSLGRLVRSSHTDGVGATIQRTEHIYDAYNRLKTQKWTINGKTRSETYTYDDTEGSDGSLKQLKTTSGQKINYTYDALRRLSKTSVTNSSGVALFNTAYAYRTINGSQSTMQVSSRDIKLDGGASVLDCDYTYDTLGNIKTATEKKQPANGKASTTTVTYGYDEQNQLVSAQYSGTKTDTISYTYDTAGNILSEAHGGAVTKTYTYAYNDTSTLNDAWPDLLVAVNKQAITYDGSGNPETYYNGNKTFTSLKWEQGRQLISVTTGGKTTRYTYDADGIRTTKVVDGVEHRYVTRGGKLMRESFGSGDTEVIMDFSYDESGRPFAVSYSKDGGASFSTYYYATNLQGDVVMLFGRSAVKDANGNVTGYTVKSYGYYEYDPWGNVTVKAAAGGTPSTSSLINRNPIRYRGYVYDNETGFYYLQSRYYDPANHRFINADAAKYAANSSINIHDTNLFAYCGNNPIMRTDSTGTSWFSSIISAVAVVAVAAVAVVAVVASAGAVACVAGAAATAAGASAATAATVSTAATIGCYAVASGIGACGLSDAGEVLTGTNVVRDYAFGGNQEAYDTFKGVLSLAAYGITELASNAQQAGVCFVAGTPVLTASEPKPIEDIKAGDMVWAWDESTGEVALKQVVETYVNETTELTHIFVNGEEIVCTSTHPFYSPVKGWTAAAKLRAGDILVLVNGEYVVLEKVQHELLESPVKVYNFQVEDYHTYYVADSGVLVHNSCNHNSKWDSERRHFWKETGKTAVEGKNYGAYVADKDNIGRMNQGLAPIGWDKASVQLHHWKGIANDFYDYSPVSRTLHKIIHRVTK